MAGSRTSVTQWDVVLLEAEQYGTFLTALDYVGYVSRTALDSIDVQRRLALAPVVERLDDRYDPGHPLVTPSIPLVTSIQLDALNIITYQALFVLAAQPGWELEDHLYSVRVSVARYEEMVRALGLPDILSRFSGQVPRVVDPRVLHAFGMRDPRAVAREWAGVAFLKEGDREGEWADLCDMLDRSSAPPQLVTGEGFRSDEDGIMQPSSAPSLGIRSVTSPVETIRPLRRHSEGRLRNSLGRGRAIAGMTSAPAVRWDVILLSAAQRDSLIVGLDFASYGVRRLVDRFDSPRRDIMVQVADRLSEHYQEGREPQPAGSDALEELLHIVVTRALLKVLDAPWQNSAQLYEVGLESAQYERLMHRAILPGGGLEHFPGMPPRLTSSEVLNDLSFDADEGFRREWPAVLFFRGREYTDTWTELIRMMDDSSMPSTPTSDLPPLAGQQGGITSAVDNPGTNDRASESRQPDDLDSFARQAARLMQSGSTPRVTSRSPLGIPRVSRRGLILGGLGILGVGTAIAVSIARSSDQPRDDLHEGTDFNVLSVGAGPGRMTISPDGATVYVLNPFLASVQVIATEDMRFVENVEVGSPLDVAVSGDGSLVCVVGGPTGLFSVIDTSSYLVSNSISVPSGMVQVVAPQEGRLVYAANAATGSVVTVDLGTNRMISETSLPVAHVRTLVLDPNGDLIYAVSGDSRTVVVLDSSSGMKTMSTLAVPSEIMLTNIAFLPGLTGTALITSDNDTLSLLDTVSGVVTRQIQAPSPLYDITPDPQGRFLYASNQARSTITRIEVASGDVETSGRTGYSVDNIEVSSDGETLYATDTGAGVLMQLDVASLFS